MRPLLVATLALAAFSIGIPTSIAHAAPVGALALDRHAPGTLYAGTGDGVLKSTDGGASWVVAHPLFDFERAANLLVIDPVTPGILYASAGHPDGDADPGSGFYRSTTGGDSWTYLNRAAIALAIDPASPSTLYAVFYFYDIDDNGRSAVFKSTDRGDTWTRSDAGITSWFTHSLAIDPVTPSTVYAGTTRGVYKSTDSGASWRRMWAFDDQEIFHLAVPPTTPSRLYIATATTAGRISDSSGSLYGLGVSIRSIAIDPALPSTVYAATAGGLFKSLTGGDSWARVTGEGLPDSLYDLAIDPTAPSTLYVTTDAGLYKSVNGGASWTLTWGAVLPNPPITCGPTPCACGNLVTTSRVLTRADPVTWVPCPGDGLLVADGVELDLGGRTLRGAGAGTGLRIAPGASVVLKRGRVVDFETGVATDTTTTGSVLSRLTIRAGFHGIRLVGREMTVASSLVHGVSGDGIHLVGDDNAIRNTAVKQAGGGVRVDGADNIITNTTVSRSLGHGLEVHGVRARVERNQTTRNGGDGLTLFGSDHAVSSNRTADNAGHGLLMHAEASTLDRNRSTGNGGLGIADMTTGGGTAGTANAYRGTLCGKANGLGPSSPPGLCR